MQGIVSLILAQPEMMGPWLANAFFTGDYSVGQRVGILSGLGLAGQRLAVLERDDSQQPTKSSFPSKALPERLHNLYSEDSGMNTIVKRMEDSMLDPVAGRPRKKAIRNDLSKLLATSFFFSLTGRWQALGHQKRYVNIKDPPLTRALRVVTEG